MGIWDLRQGRAAGLGLVAATAFLSVSPPRPAVAAEPGPAKAWDVTDTGQPSTEASFTVTEGTWISVAVSPDGKTLVFDVLGDIYRMPATGGDATLVHGGPAIQHGASFSPDGSKLLYLSDASGNENAWISNVDGSDPRRVTDEAVDQVAGPAWAPDGLSIVASKTIASFAKIYTSELRLFDLTRNANTAGRVVVETPANKRDVQEPKFSPDGRYLYYAERLSAPYIFVDANHINYAIKRRDLQTGLTDELVGGFGSATTPEISRDGKRIAFVRRVKEKTVLFVYDTETRLQRPVFEGLDRDAHADFVPQGAYYPQFGWFPDNRSIAIWAKGKLVRIDTENGQAADIPFRVTSSHKLITPPRIQTHLAPDRLQVRAVQQIAPAPDGKSVVFAAVGHLWSKPLPGGTPQRLTKATAFEFEPAWSVDGKQLAYVEFDDEKGSALRVLAPGKGQPRTVATDRGVIRQPAFSRDGKKLTYRIQEPDKSMGGYTSKSGIYWVPVAGGEPRAVADKGLAPQFSADGNEIFYSNVSARQTHLYSVGLDGKDQREHANTPDADTIDLRISPDQRWIAFRDRQQYYVMPYHATGTAQTVEAAGKAMPVARLTEIGGYGLTWSADSAALQWMVGPQLYRADVAAQFKPDAKPPQPYASVDLQVPVDKPAGLVAFTNGRVITMRGDEVIERGTVLVRDNKIAAVGPSDQVQIPSGTKVIDAAGKTVMPGLVDMHGHTDCCYGVGVASQKQPTRYAQLAFGVTTNFDPYSNELTTYQSNETNLAGLTVSPRWVGVGLVVYGRSGKPDFNYVPMREYADAVALMRRKHEMGGIVIKSYKQTQRAARQMLIKAGREQGVMVDVEGESHFYNNLSMILDGHMSLEHNLPVATYYDDLVQLMSRGAMSHTPTLVVLFAELFGENYYWQNTRAWDDPKIRTFVQETTSGYSALKPGGSAPPHVRGMTTLHAAEEVYEIGFRSVARSIKKLDDAGVTINVGSHGQIAGLSMHWEMWLLSQGGIANHRLLRMATLNGAKTLGFDKQIGSLEPGKLADIIVLDANPLEKIQNTNTVRYTMLNGRLYDSLTMNEIGNYNRPRGKFFWETNDYRGIDWNETWSAD